MGELTEDVKKWMTSLDDVEQLSADVQVLQSVDADVHQLLGGQSELRVDLVSFVDHKHHDRHRMAIHKTAKSWADPDDVKTQADAEQLGFLVHNALGSRTAGVYRDDRDSVWIEYVEGVNVGEAASTGSSTFYQSYLQWETSPERMRMGLADVLIGNGDRHDGNIIVTDEGEFVGIDHGYAFGMLGFNNEDGSVSPNDVGGSLDERPAGFFVEGIEAGSERQNQFVDNPLTQSDVDEARARLESLRDDFKHVGREAWLDKSLAMLDELAKHAAGGEPIF